MPRGRKRSSKPQEPANRNLIRLNGRFKETGVGFQERHLIKPALESQRKKPHDRGEPWDMPPGLFDDPEG